MSALPPSSAVSVPAAMAGVPAATAHAAAPRPLKALLVDPSLFTAPYDAALTDGLLAAGVEPCWATRPVRRGDRHEIAPRYVDDFFYRRVDEAAGLPGVLRAVAKGCAHALGLVRLVARVARTKPDVVHVQWSVLPPLDALAFLALRRLAPLVLTVHDTVPFNGQRMSPWQNWGFDVPIRLAHAVVVHTQAGRATLVARGVAPGKITVIPHGPLALAAAPDPRRPPRDARWTMVLFGEIKSYKGLDVLVEALARLPADVRAALRVVVAGRPRMDMAPLLARIEALGLGGTLDLRLRRQSDQEMADLFADADGFVFPYRQIDASGVYFLVKSLGAWLIASRVGIFAEDLDEGTEGVLVPSGDVPALAHELERAVRTRPPRRTASAASSWEAIGRATRALYERCAAARRP